MTATCRRVGMSDLQHEEEPLLREGDIEDDGIDVQFTWRAALVGSLLGCVVSASNMYLGLKSGWTFGASIFGAILGYTLLKAMSRLQGVPFGMKENCTVQTAATAAGGLSAGFVAGVPAMFRLGLLPALEECWGMFFLWTLAAGFYGMFFAIPLRTYFIIQQKLVFPSCTAAAHTIRTLHTGDGKEAEEQARWILWSFMGSMGYKLVSFFVPFVVDMHPLYYVYKVTGASVLREIDVTWKWKFQISTAFYGAGMMVGMNTALSFLAGDILAWAVLGPLLMYIPSTDVLHDSPYGLAEDGARAQYWLLWVGIVIMLCASFTELAMQYSSVWHGVRGGFMQLHYSLAPLLGLPRPTLQTNADDPATEDEQVAAWMWMGGLSFSCVLTLAVVYFYFDMSLGVGVVAIVLGFAFSFIGCQSSGETDMNPTGVIGKASQFVFATIPAPTVRLQQTHNLIAGILSSSCASQAVDMVGDLKTGHLLRASPRSQFYAQMVGATFGIVVSVLLFMLFGQAYPCILKEPAVGEHCEFPAPAVAAWAGVTRALTSDISKNVPPSCRVACVIFAMLTIATIVLKNTLLRSKAHLLPNWNAIGIAFVNPAPYIPLANFIGALIGYIWSTKNPRHWNLVGISLASGLIAGEGVGGVFHAFFQIIGWKQSELGSGFGCPGYIPDNC
ncbi:hypothetical protein DSO57_1029473 [Entomophthora muscae]|uniref:Uncharacterized protein n=1 Tax=Entomophthora muscae TaxID=34485 RepID=A0ACC2TZE6_9FUNG|nr:hypothetical protein DSO57_1029473 [Entomophthora muscae]